MRSDLFHPLWWRSDHPVSRFRGARRRRDDTDRVTKQIPTHEPSELVIGSSWAWDVAYPDFPADDGWQLSYTLRGPDDMDLAWGTHVAAAAAGSSFEIRVTATQSAEGVAVPGAYRLVGRVNKTGDTWDGEIVHNEHLLVLADPSTAVGAKSFNRRMLEAIETALAAGISSSAEAQKITINGRTIEYRDRSELDTLHARYRYLVSIEENPTGRVVNEVAFTRA